MFDFGPLPPSMPGALCAEADPALFYPEQGEGSHVRKAKKLCAKCPVKDACLQAALDRREGFGIWGGTTERDRRRLLRADACQADGCDELATTGASGKPSMFCSATCKSRYYRAKRAAA